MVDVFACAGCDTVLTAPVSQVALPVHAHHSYGHETLSALMEPGTYVVDPAPSGPPPTFGAVPLTPSAPPPIAQPKWPTPPSPCWTRTTSFCA